MRVITGSKRGRRLKTLEGNDVRPTTDKVKESVFNIIQFDIEGRNVLDLFSGSGQLGIEALSRGASMCTFVDSSRASLGVTSENIKAVGFEKESRAVLSDALSFLDRDLNKYDLAFLDPPYKAGLMSEALIRLLSHMTKGSTVVCETDSSEELPESVGDFSAKTYKYGKIKLTVYRN